MQILINGLITGLTLALLALGFMVVYLALGAIYTLVPFVA
jgi:branched-subunit amino acid ABC-type transport system permease component